MKSSIANAKTFLFVPASRPERIEKAIATSTDVVIVDLEDAVAPSEKTGARVALLEWLASNPGQNVVVRVNAADTEWHEDDLAACRHAGVSSLLLPKAESANQVEHAFAAAGKAVLPIVETVRGIEALKEIASASGCARLTFGKLDLAVELDLVPDEGDLEELVFLPYRAMLVVASKAAGLPAPVDGVFTAFGDDASLASYARRARRHGFGGMLLIHPKQVATVTAAFTPSQADVSWALAVRDAARAAGGGAVVLDGRMVDAPVIARAERILVAANLV